VFLKSLHFQLTESVPLKKEADFLLRKTPWCEDTHYTFLFDQKFSDINGVSCATLAILPTYCKRVESVIDGEWLPGGKTRPATRYIAHPKT
jgi:hypothetical protein